MKIVRRTRMLPIVGMMLAILTWLANSTNPPNGRTGAPFDTHCGNCHNGGSYNGTVTVEGMPATVEPNTVYPLMITLTPTAGSPITGGFQLVAVDANNNNCGNLAASNAQSGTEFAGGREYIDHRGDKSFGGNPISWNFTWESPGNVPGNLIKFYFIGNFTNNNNNDSGDNAFDFLETYAFSGPPPLAASINDINNVLCFGGNTGSATVEVSGGVAPYTYLWSNGQTVATAINLVAGNYFVTVTGSQGSGTTTAFGTVGQPTQINTSVSTDGTLSCANPDVTLTATASGGTPGYTYGWSTNDMGNPIVVSSAGTYIVTVTDNNNCTKTATAMVTGTINPPTATIAPPGTITCTTPSITLNATGSTTGPQITHAWSTPNGNIVSGINTLMPVVNAAGTYNLLVTNNSTGCTATASVVVSANTTAPNSTAVGGTLNCVVSSITLNGGSTTSNTTFAWTGPNGFTSTLQDPVVSLQGNYILTVTNTTNGCTSSATATVDQNLSPPSATAVGGNLNCAVSSITLNGGSPTSGVTYAWTGPNGYTSNIEDPVVNLPGNYILTVTNPINGCASSATATVNQDLAPPTAVVAMPSNLNCLVIQLQLDGSGSSQGPAFTYSWTTSTGNIVSGGTTLTPIINQPGTYVLLVTNTSNGCTQTASTTVQQSPPVTIALQNSSNVSCFGQSNGTATVLGGGGQGSFNYQWNTGDSTNSVTGLVAGTYTVSVTDVEGCTAGLTVTITQPDALNANATATSETTQGGNDGTALAAPTGGLQPYGYVWNNGDTVPLIDSLPPGAYTVSVTDNNGCTSVQTVNVNAFNCALTATISATQVLCNGAANGTATLNSSGGALPLVILWSNGASTPAISNLAPGTYTASITDANNCSFVISTQITEPAVLSANAVSTNESALDANDGTATASPTGGNQPYSFSWNNGETLPQIDSLPPGVYTVSVTDNNGCSAVQTVNVNAFNCALTFTSNIQPVSCFGGSDGQASVVLNGGSVPYAYLWSNGATSATVSNLTAGAYTVSMSDAFGCMLTTILEITQPTAVVAVIDNVQHDVNNSQTGSISVTVTGGNGGYTYLWSKNGFGFTSTEDITGLGAGSYQLIATDTRGCTVVLGPIVVDNTVASTEPGKEAIRLLLWPNPALDIIHISWNSSEQPAFARVVDIRGQYAMELTSDQLVQPILVQQLPAGLYVLQVLFANGSVSSVHWMKSE